jgi:hypothetical protein
MLISLLLQRPDTQPPLFFGNGYRLFRTGIVTGKAHVADILCFVYDLRLFFATIGIDQDPQLKAAPINAFSAAPAFCGIDTVLDHTMLHYL